MSGQGNGDPRPPQGEVDSNSAARRSSMGVWLMGTGEHLAEYYNWPRKRAASKRWNAKFLTDLRALVAQIEDELKL